ncbi:MULTISPECIES: hypothetical protein [unclassified Ensifer]|uniref:hypothetical protein n=1 Tax=unclassified Ensifer TaxID=2633371 RepID=UPI00070F58D1|nr:MULTISPECIES: hypothetical protein [unclassified Ensifer]KQW58629.1 hypothetical protein ASD02_06470 [Ensifer sp. Root1252]KRC67464.1 hypothetical protein ASE32_09930 [Ensifer sp. Root231]KRC98541.1 hypothetical protein ASE47_05125 [Ensifer sp. Root258]
MTEKTFLTIAAAIFGIVAMVHLVRILIGFSVVIDGWTVPMWVSWVGLIVSGGLSYYGAKFAKLI